MAPHAEEPAHNPPAGFNDQWSWSGLTKTISHQTTHTEANSFWSHTLAASNTRHAVQSISAAAIVEDGRVSKRGTLVVDIEEDSLLDHLDTIQGQCKCTREVLIEAVWALVLRHHSSSEEVMFGVIRDPAEHATSVDLDHAYPMRVMVQTEHNFEDLIRDISKFHNKAKPWLGTSYSDIAPMLHEPIESAVYYSPSHRTPSQGSRSLFPMILGITGSLRLRATLDYSSSIDAREAEYLVSHFIAGLRECLFKIYLPHTVVEKIDLASDTEIFQVVKKNRSDKKGLYTTIVHLLEDAAVRFADRCAIEDDRHDSLTYAELDAYSNGLAHCLQIDQHDIVPICMHRSIDLVLSVIAVLKCGAAYTVLDPDAPFERNEQIVAECGAQAVLVRGDTNLPFNNSVNVQELVRNTSELDSSLLDIEIRPEDRCYVIFTSGSSGKPKGVVCSHQAATNGMKYHSLNGKSRWLLFYNPSFSAAQRTMLSTLVRGGTLIIARPEKLQAELPQIINELDVTSLGITPSALSTLKPEEVPGLQQVTLVGERIQQDLVQEWAPHLELRNTYGLSEVTQLNFGTRLTSDSNPRVVGAPKDTTSAYVFHPGTTDLAPVGVAGELCLAGPQLGEGYLNDPTKSEQVFIDNPVGPGKLYRTGDEARMLHDGTFEIIGRIDFQAKVNGQKVEPQEIDNVFSRHGSIAGSVTVGALVGERTLLATGVVLEDDVDWSTESLSSLKAHAQELLPRYMVPSYIIPIPNIPQNQNGKVDLRSFKKWVESKTVGDLVELSSPDGEQVALIDEKEIDIAKVWAEELKLDQAVIKPTHSFVGLGGSSIQAIRTMAKLRKVGFMVTLVDALGEMSLRDIAAKYRRFSRTELAHEFKPFELLEDEELRESLQQEKGTVDAYPATPLQQDLLASLASNDTTYTYRRTWDVSSLDIHKLRQSFEQVFQSNEILRTTFLLHKRTMLQLVHSDLELPWYESNLGLDEFLLEDAKRVMTMEDLLFRVTLVQGGVLVVSMHHALFDFWSHRFLYADVAARYLDQPVVQRPKFNTFIASLKETSDNIEDATFWKQYLHGAEPTTLNTIPASDTVKLRYVLPYSLQNRFKDQPYTTGAMLYTAWAMVLAKNTGSKDVVFLTSLSGRDAPVLGVEDIDGPTLAMVPQRVVFQDERSLTETVKEVGTQLLQLASHAKYGLSNALASGGIDHAYFDSFLNILVSPEQDSSTASVFQRHGPPSHWEQQWTTIDVEESTATTTLRIAGRMEDRRLQFLLESFIAAINFLAESSLAKFSEVSVMGDAEYSLLYYQLSHREDLHVPDKSLLHSRFEEHAKNNPRAVAIDWNGEKQLTYAELNNGANRFAHLLIKSGVKTGDLVPLLLERSMDTMIAILGVMKAGAAYVPMDPANPASRNSFIVQDVKATVVVVHREHYPEWSEVGGLRIIVIDEVNLSSMPLGKPKTTVTPDGLAYVIYTSGSTGQPKGVRVPHYTAAAAVTSMEVVEGRNDGEWRTLQFANYVFDASVQDFFNTLSTCGTLCMAPKDAILSDLAGTMNRTKTRQAILTPTIARHLNPADVPTMATLIVGGEPLSSDVINAWSPGHQLLNVYGPTETSMVVTTKDVKIDSLVSNIGRPFPTVMAFIVEPDSDQMMPYGAVGELCIAGPQVTAGYLNRPDLTSAAFVGGQSLGVERLYRTGDLAHWLPNGDIACLGRKDGQVKIHGHRIELGEIEVAILKTELVKEAAVIVATVNDKPALTAFCLFDEPTPEFTTLSTEQTGNITGQVQEKLIDSGLTPYMIPRLIVPVSQMPKLVSRKVDRKLLKRVINEMDPALARTYAATGDKHEAMPVETDEEAALEGFWSQVLHVPTAEIGRKADFMDLGGDSIAAISLSSVANKAGYILSVGNILKFSVLQGMADKMSRKKEQIGPKRNFVVPEDVIESTRSTGLSMETDVDYVYPCPPGQAEFLEQGSRPEQMWRMMASRRLPTSVKAEAWLEATTALIRADDILRTSFIKSADNSWYGVVLRSTTPEVTHVSCANEEERKAAIEVCWGPAFKFGKPFIKFYMLTHADGALEVCIKMDHAVYDGTSLRIFDDHFESILAGNPLPEHEQFKDFAFHIFESDKASTLDYWKKLMEGANQDSVYLNQATEPKITAVKRALVPTKLDHLARSCGVTPSSIFQAAYQVWLANAAKSVDVGFDYLLSGRNIDMPNPLTINGTLANFLPMRLQLSKESTLYDYLQQTQDAFWALTAHGNVGLDEIYEATRLDRKIIGNRTLFLFQPFEPVGMPDESRWLIMAKSQVRMFQPYGLVVEAGKAPNDQHKLAAMYDDRYFSAADVEGILAEMQRILDWFVEQGEDGKAVMKGVLA